MRSTALPSVLASLALFAVSACSGPATPDDTTVDGGGSDAGTTTDAGVDAGPPPCTDGAEEACPGVSTGTCTPGTRTCVAGLWEACAGRRQPAPGACDFASCEDPNLENPGCACRVGAVKDCYEGEEGTLGKGTCQKGFSECAATAAGSAWGSCAGQVLPSTDDCSGRDFDCDSEAPATCTCTGAATRPCGGVTGGTCELGTQTCTGGKYEDCVGAVQPISGNCDVLSCAGTPNPGCACRVDAVEPCYTGVFGTDTEGTCHAGTRTCGGSGNWGACGSQERPVPICDLGLSCTGGHAPGCE